MKNMTLKQLDRKKVILKTGIQGYHTYLPKGTLMEIVIISKYAKYLFTKINYGGVLVKEYILIQNKKHLDEIAELMLE